MNRKAPVLIAGVLVAGGATSALAGTRSIVQTFDFDLMITGEPIEFTLDGFDDQGGTRQLDSVTFDWDLNYRFDYQLESTGPTAVSMDDFVINSEFQTLHQIGNAVDSPFFYGFGGFFESYSADLPAFTKPGANVVTGGFEVDGMVSRSFAMGDDSGVVEYYSRTGAIDNVLGGFGLSQFFWLNEPVGWDPSDPFTGPVYPIDDAIWLTVLDSSAQWGTLTATFEYSIVPAPGAAAVLGCVALGMARRRR